MPGRTTSHRFHYVYVLKSQRDNNNYIGYTTDLKRRFNEHNKGLNVSTKPRRPFILIYYEACISEIDARRREEYLKTTGGRRFLIKRLKTFLSSSMWSCTTGYA